MNYIDANVFLNAFLVEGAKAEYNKNVLKAIASGAINAATSALTWDEVTWVTKRHLGEDDSLNEGKKLLEFSALTFLPVTEAIVRSAQSMREKYGLGPRDAIHGASAIACGAAVIISEDPDFDKVKEIERIPPEKFAARK